MTDLENRDLKSAGTNGQWTFDAFISYSTAADYRTANQLESYFERFHREPGIEDHRFSPLRICLDGSDFTLPRHGLSRSKEAHGGNKRIEELIADYLQQSAALLVLWPGLDGASNFMDWELREFLAQNERNNWDRPVLIAVTRGKEPAANPESFFSLSQIEKGLHQNIFYDFRGLHPEHGTWAKVRDFEKERFRLAIDLLNTREQLHLSSDDIFPAWKREQLQLFRNAQINLSFRGAFGFAAAMAILVVIFFFRLAPREWLVAGGIPSAGALGGLLCSFRPRSAPAFFLGFCALVPFYILGSLRPFDNALLEALLFSCATVFGFSIAGGIGSTLSRQMPWSAGSRALFLLVASLQPFRGSFLSTSVQRMRFNFRLDRSYQSVMRF